MYIGSFVYFPFLKSHLVLPFPIFHGENSWYLRHPCWKRHRCTTAHSCLWYALEYLAISDVLFKLPSLFYHMLLTLRLYIGKSTHFLQLLLHHHDSLGFFLFPFSVVAVYVIGVGLPNEKLTSHPTQDRTRRRFRQTILYCFHCKEQIQTENRPSTDPLFYIMEPYSIQEVYTPAYALDFNVFKVYFVVILSL